MSAKPERQQFMEELGTILDEYAEWYNHVIRAVFYASELGKADHLERPEKFPAWLDEAKTNHYLDINLIEQLNTIDSDLVETAGKFYVYADQQKKPPLTEFDDFRTVYEDFHGRVHRIEQDSQLSDSGIDAETGLRSMSVFERDLSREMERRARSSVPFCLAAVRVDHVASVKEQDMAIKIIQKAAEGVQACLRTFDDAYRHDAHHFILCLKNTDFAGANAAINRINRYFRNENMVFGRDGGSVPITISSTIAEVLPTDNLDEMVQNLVNDVEKNADEPGTVLQLQELSELQKFVKGMGE